VLAYVTVFCNVLVGLLFTPFLVRTLGKSEYGLFMLVGSLISQLGVLDLGLSSSAVRFLTRYRALKDRQGEENILAIFCLVYSAVGCAMAGAGAYLLYLLPRLLHETASVNDRETAQVLFLILLVNLVGTILFNGISSTLISYERFVLLRSLDLGARLLAPLVSVGFLLSGFGVVAVAGVSAAVNMTVVLIKVIYAFRVLKLFPVIHKLDRTQIGEVLSFSGSVFVSVIVEQIYWKLDILLLGSMMGTIPVAIYSIGSSFHKYFMSFGTAISRVLVPKVVCEVETGASPEELTSLLVSASRKQASVLLLLLSGLILFGREFIHLWVGPDFDLAYFVMLANLIPFTADLIGNLRNVILEVTGFNWYRSGLRLVLALFNVAATIPLISMYGIVGAATATGVGILIGYLVTNELLRRMVGIQVGRFHSELLSGILPAVLISMSFGVCIRSLGGGGWWLFLAKIILYSAVYGGCMWIIGMNRAERDLVAQLVRPLLMRFRLCPGESIGCEAGDEASPSEHRSEAEDS
jgi:O-antigen/teichoic acid export membrane protein